MWSLRYGTSLDWMLMIWQILETEVARSPTRRVLSVEETESGEEGEGEGESELREGDGDRECNDVHEV